MLREEGVNYPSGLPGVLNTTPKLYACSCCAFLTDIFPLLSLSLRMNNVLSTLERNMVGGKVWPCLPFSTALQLMS